MVEESRRVNIEGEYWAAIRLLNASPNNAEAIESLIRIASGNFGSVSQWAKQSLESKLSVQLVTI